jgi:hypothetical protein
MQLRTLVVRPFGSLRGCARRKCSVGDACFEPAPFLRRSNSVLSVLSVLQIASGSFPFRRRAQFSFSSGSQISISAPGAGEIDLLRGMKEEIPGRPAVMG